MISDQEYLFYFSFLVFLLVVLNCRGGKRPPAPTARLSKTVRYVAGPYLFKVVLRVFELHEEEDVRKFIRQQGSVCVCTYACVQARGCLIVMGCY